MPADRPWEKVLNAPRIATLAVAALAVVLAEVW
jgi:hypothetical protein